MQYTKIEATRENAAEIVEMLLDAGYEVIGDVPECIHLESGTHRVSIMERKVEEAEGWELMPWLTEEEYNN